MLLSGWKEEKQNTVKSTINQRNIFWKQLTQNNGSIKQTTQTLYLVEAEVDVPMLLILLDMSMVCTYFKGSGLDWFPGLRQTLYLTFRGENTGQPLPDLPKPRRDRHYWCRPPRERLVHWSCPGRSSSGNWMVAWRRHSYKYWLGEARGSRSFEKWALFRKIAKTTPFFLSEWGGVVAILHPFVLCRGSRM